MNNILSLYYDGAVIQAARVGIENNIVTVNDARTFSFDDLEDFLSSCSEKRCVICSNPQQFYQDIIHLPPAADKLYDRLIRNEIQSAHPDLTAFSFFYRIVGESTIETRPYSKIAVFSYPDDFLADFIGELNRFGVSVSSIYAAPYSLFRLVLSIGAADQSQARIFAASILGEKLLLVCENNELEFIRKIPSFESAMRPEDAHNINMTVDYCFQTLRVRPSETVMIGAMDSSEELTKRISIPYRSVLPPMLADIPLDTVQDYLAPLATAVHHADSPRSGNILPADYVACAKHRKLLKTSIISLMIILFILIACAASEHMKIADLNARVGKIRIEIGGAASELATFKQLDADLAQLKQPLEFVNKHNLSPNPAMSLAAFNLPEAQDREIKSVIAQSADGAVSVKVSGKIIATGYGNTQAAFEKLVAQIAKLPGYSVTSSSIDIKQKTFNLQTLYKSGGRQVR